MKKLVATIRDESETLATMRKDKITVTADARGVYIAVKGYCDANGGDEIIMLENYGGKLRLHIWGDVKDCEPNYTIDLEKAKEEVCS